MNRERDDGKIDDRDKMSSAENKRMFELFKTAIDKAGRPLTGLQDFLQWCPTPEAEELVRKAYAEGFGDVDRIFEHHGRVYMHPVDRSLN
jgi:hypothetical protein